MSRIVWLAWISMIASTAQAQTSWRLEWADELDGPANSAPDRAKWTRDLGHSGWGNKELENYTNSTENAPECQRAGPAPGSHAGHGRQRPRGDRPRAAPGTPEHDGRGRRPGRA